MKKRMIIRGLILCCFLLANVAVAQTFIEVRNQTEENSNKIDSMSSEISLIKERLLDLKGNYQLLYEGAKDQNNQLSQQIEFFSVALGAISLFLTIVGFVLAVYISEKYKQVVALSKLVRETREYVDGNNEKLFQKLKRNETIYLLKRLVEVPEDIGNIIYQLLSRDLIHEDFIPIKTAYLRIRGRINSNQYMILFLQHFTYEALKDSDLKSDIIQHISVSSINQMFDRDFVKFSEDIVKYLSEIGVDTVDGQTILPRFFSGYYNSRHRVDTSLQDKFKTLLNKSNLHLRATHVLQPDEPEESVYRTWVNSILSN